MLNISCDLLNIVLKVENRVAEGYRTVVSASAAYPTDRVADRELPLPSITRGGGRCLDLSWKAQSFVIIIQGTERARITLGNWWGRGGILYLGSKGPPCCQNHPPSPSSLTSLQHLIFDIVGQDHFLKGSFFHPLFCHSSTPAFSFPALFHQLLAS